MISTLSWIRSGTATAEPKKQQLTDEEYAAIMAKIDAHLPSPMDVEEEAEESGEQMALPLTKNISSLLHHPDNDDQKEEAEEEEKMERESLEDRKMMRELDAKDEAEELEEARILPDDRIIVVGRTEDDVSYVDMYVYEQAEANLYVHHDLMLPAIPLAIQPLATAARGNLVAVGTFDADIEVWDMDVLEPAFPVHILSAPSATANKKGDYDKRKKKHSRKAERAEEEDGMRAVMALSWNAAAFAVGKQSLLAAGSADGAVRVWDVHAEQVLWQSSTLHAHSKVQCVQWTNLPAEPMVLATSAYDRTVQIVSFQQHEENGGKELKALTSFTLDAHLPSDPECMAWDPLRPGRLFVACEDGTVRMYDVANRSMLGVIQDVPCSAVSVSPFLANVLLVAGGTEWSILQVADDGSYRVLVERTTAERVFAAQWSPDTPWLLTVAGASTDLAVVNLQLDDATRALWNDLLRSATI